MLGAIGKLHHVATINTTLVQAYIRFHAALCSVISLPGHSVEYWREVFLSLCSCAWVWSMFWGEAQSGAEPVLLHIFGLDGTLEWFGYLDNGQAPHTEQEATDGSGNCSTSLISTCMEGLTLLAQLATYGCACTHTHSSL